jgi:hypothetical protein
MSPAGCGGSAAAVPDYRKDAFFCTPEAIPCSKRIMKRLLKYLVWAFFAVIAVSLALWVPYGLTPKLIGTSISPRQVYRLEYYDASPLQRLFHMDMKLPGFVRLYRINPEALMEESKVVDLWINGQLYWYLNPPISTIQVGRDVVFEGIPPECTDCPPLTEKQIMP